VAKELKEPVVGATPRSKTTLAAEAVFTAITSGTQTHYEGGKSNPLVILADHMRSKTSLAPFR
jgi:hypothetical protein